jgi:DNA-binding CsgD family transcriptional regulator
MIQQKSAQQDFEYILANNPRIKALLYQKAKDRATPLRWNTNILILVSVNLMTTILLTLWGVSLVITGIVAIAGLLLVWGLSVRQEKRLANKFFQQELQELKDLDTAPATPSPKNNSVGITTAPTPPEMPITQRELEIMAQMASGKVNKEIATALNISAMTVKNHISHILEKLDVNDRTSAVLLAVRNGWITLDKV